MIVVLTGKSCSGKDRVREKLCGERKEYKYEKMISYTTRPMRSGEKNGVDYWFINNEEMDFLRNKGYILDYREYKVSGGDIWGYGHFNNDKDVFKNEIYIAIADLDGAKTFKEAYGDDCIVIYIEAPYYQRRARANIRDDNKKEIERRFKQDDIDFSNEKLYNIIDFSVENLDGYLNETVDVIINYIENIRKES